MEQINLPRRRLLKLGLVAATGLAAVGGGAVWLLRSGAESLHPSGTQFGKLMVLDHKRASILNAFAEAALPMGEGFPTVREAQVIERLDEELYFVSAGLRSDVLSALDALNLLPFLYGHFSTFSVLGLEDRIVVLNGTRSTRSDTVRAVVNALRMLTAMMYYGHESSWAAIGYDGPFARLEPIMSEQRIHYARLTGRA